MAAVVAGSSLPFSPVPAALVPVESSVDTRIWSQMVPPSAPVEDEGAVAAGVEEEEEADDGEDSAVCCSPASAGLLSSVVSVVWAIALIFLSVKPTLCFGHTNGLFCQNPVFVPLS